jgi:hypothetical protein
MIPLLVAGAATAAASAAAVKGLFLGYPDKTIDLGALGAKEQAIVAACADAFFPPGGPIPVSGIDAGLVPYFDEYVSRLPQTQALLVRLLLWFIEHGPWVFGPKPVRFTRLSHEDRIKVLARMQDSPIYFRRVAFLSMRTILTMGYLANVDVMRAMHMRHDADPFGIGRKEAVPAGAGVPA